MQPWLEVLPPREPHRFRATFGTRWRNTTGSRERCTAVLCVGVPDCLLCGRAMLQYSLLAEALLVIPYDSSGGQTTSTTKQTDAHRFLSLDQERASLASWLILAPQPKQDTGITGLPRRILLRLLPPSLPVLRLCPRRPRPPLHWASGLTGLLGRGYTHLLPRIPSAGMMVVEDRLPLPIPTRWEAVVVRQQMLVLESVMSSRIGPI